MESKVLKILVDLIDDPAVAMRTQFSDEGLQDLAQSIQTNGLIQPIILKEKNGRYEVVAGHRRLKAHRLLHATHIEAIVKVYTDEQAESAKVHENLFREDVNPVDQAMFLARYVETTKADINALSKMLNRTPEWVAGRLEILKYPDYLIDEVYKGGISLGVARCLSEITNETTRKEYTRFAALQGINIRTAKRWAQQSYAGTLPANPAQLPEGADPYETEPQDLLTTCVICQARESILKMQTDFVHPECRFEMQQEVTKLHSELAEMVPAKKE